MGYYSTARGEITFSPELDRYTARGNAVIYKYLESDDIYLNVEWSTITAPEDTFKAYWIKDNLQELVDAILKIEPDTEFKGYLEIQGEGDGTGDIDLWRLKVKDGRVVEVTPKLVWPDDE